MTDDDELRREVDEAARPVIADVCRMIDALHTALGGPEGLAMIEAMIEARDAARAAWEAWEAAHPGLRYGDLCNCNCRVRGHGSGWCVSGALSSPRAHS